MNVFVFVCVCGGCVRAYEGERERERKKLRENERGRQRENHENIQKKLRNDTE